MEAGVTTATRRLRRASIAGLASIATAGVTVLATGGSAFALTDASATLASKSVSTLTATGSGQALGDLTLTFQDTSGSPVFSAGEQLTFELTDNAGAELTDTTTNTLNYIAFAGAPTVTADNGASASVSLAQGAKSNQNDEFVLTFTKDAAKDTNKTTFTISGLKVNIGSKFAAAGTNVYVTATATTPSTAKPFAGPAASQTVKVATIPQVSVTTSKVAVSAGGATNVALGTISIKDVVGGSIASGDTVSVVLDNGAVFTTAPTASGTPAVSNIALATTTTANDTVTFKVGAATAAGNTITLSGAKITNAAAGKAVTATVDDATTALGIAGTVKVAVAVDQARLGGADRYGTASIVFKDGGFSSNAVVLTSGANFPDALSAQYLASALSGANTVGILTTDPNSLPAQTRTQLVNGTIDTVYIVGGTAAVSANVANQVAALHVGNSPIGANLNVIRIAGADRYATNSAADLYLGATGTTSHAFIATGANFADALAIGPVVYTTGDPLILTDGAALTASAKATIQSLGITNVTIVGGTAAISTAVETALTNLGVTIDARLSGADRTQTAAAIAKDAVANHGFNITNVYIARGDNFADALVAGPDAGLSTQPILLTGDPNTLGAGIPSVLGASTTTTSLTALGLTSAVSVSTLNAAAASIGG
jgi:putative cell wall-binding protein